MTAQPPRRPVSAPPDSDDQEGLAARAGRRIAEVEALTLLAHDLRSPLSVIVGYVQLLQRQAEKGLPEPERLLPYLERIEVAASQMTSLMDDLLADASPDAEAEPMELEPTDIAAWLREIVEHQEATVATHHVLAEAPDGPVVASVNRPKLERAIHNLVTNAVKYSDEGSTVRVVLTQVADELRIAVADEGVGIPAEDLPHIFERFHRGGNVTDRVGGLGLGLASTLRAVRAHGGQIGVESVEGAGTTFTITLPRRR